MITLVDYGLGNIQAFINIYKRLNVPVNVARTSEDLATATRLILPGVGAFDWAMHQLNQSGMRSCLDDLVRSKGLPVLGVCVGMQMLARFSEEGELPGLGWIDAEVTKMPAGPPEDQTPLPHMGWNNVVPEQTNTLFKGIADPRFYFLHSYCLVPSNSEHVLGVTNYRGAFVSAVGSGNVFGAQFHPEKSHQWGIHLLDNFAML